MLIINRIANDIILFLKMMKIRSISLVDYKLFVLLLQLKINVGKKQVIWIDYPMTQ
jgi:hypothetical protein